MKRENSDTDEIICDECGEIYNQKTGLLCPNCYPPDECYLTDKALDDLSYYSKHAPREGEIIMDCSSHEGQIFSSRRIKLLDDSLENLFCQVENIKKGNFHFEANGYMADREKKEKFEEFIMGAWGAIHEIMGLLDWEDIDDEASEDDLSDRYDDDGLNNWKPLPLPKISQEILEDGQCELDLYDEEWLNQSSDEDRLYEAIVELKVPADLPGHVQFRARLSDTIILVCGTKSALVNLIKSDNVLRITSPISLVQESKREFLEKYKGLLKEYEEIAQVMDKIGEIVEVIKEIDQINESQQPISKTATGNQPETTDPPVVKKTLFIMSDPEAVWLPEEKFLELVGENLSPEDRQMAIDLKIAAMESDLGKLTPLEDA